MGDIFLLVVGDKFLQFAVDKDAITLSQLRGLLALPAAFAAGHRRMVLVPGQGLGDADIAAVLDLAEDSPHAGLFDFGLWRSAPGRASARHSHKRHSANTIISEPRRLEDDVFELDLLIDEDCELMGDHQTGQHVQGMILVEAARQAFLAVTEVFFLPQDGKARYFVIDEMSVRFQRFVFPLGASLRYEVREKDLTPNRQRFLVDVTVEQNGSPATTVGFAFTVYPQDRISRKEGELAKTALDSHLATARETLSDANVAEAA